MTELAGPARVRVGEVELAYETFGDRGDPPVVLVMGLGGQLHYWHEEFCEQLAGRGFRVMRFDNRDVGLSTHLDSPVDRASVTPESEMPYSMSDLAGDVAGLIEALGYGSAHLVGISLGGMIAQLTAIEHPARVRSLTSIASTTGNRTAADRTRPLADLRIPALVIHGDADPLVDVSGGRATAAAIPDARLLVIEGMGHDLPRAVWDRVIDAIEQTLNCPTPRV